MTAPEASPDDTSYWVQPPAAPKFIAVEPQQKKKREKKPRFRTTTVPPTADFTVCCVYFVPGELISVIE